MVTAIGLVIFAALVAYVRLTHSDEEGTHSRGPEVTASPWRT